MKPQTDQTAANEENVASFAEAWIETSSSSKISFLAGVASFAEAWIETPQFVCCHQATNVASFAEAWIETHKEELTRFYGCRRLLRGGVD